MAPQWTGGPAVPPPHDMPSPPAFGIATTPTEHSLQPVELARWLEVRGFDALFVGEHTHLPMAPHRYGDGDLVDFDPIWCRPKPLQKGGPSILVGGGMKPQGVARRVVGYSDVWIPLDAGHEIETTLAAIRAEVSRVGRPMESLDLTVGLGLMAPVTGKRIHEVVELGFRRVLFVPGRKSRDEAWEALEAFAELNSRFA